MKHYLTAPWRAEYVRKSGGTKGCIFCQALKSKDDRKSGVLYRGQHNFIILNRYPYNPGHIMIAPGRHLADFTRARTVELQEFTHLLCQTLRVLKRHYKPHGFNVGLNFGRSAGAGVIDHFHVHVIPRWTGDSNFMPLIAKTRVFIEDLETTCRILRSSFEKEINTKANKKQPNRKAAQH